MGTGELGGAAHDRAPNDRAPFALIAPLLGTVVAGISVVGFITFFGGAVVWARADKAELPGLDIVAAVPNSMLLATGPHFLLPAVLVALAVAVILLFVYAWVEVIWRPHRSSAGRSSEEYERLRVAKAKADEEQEAARQARMLYGVTVGAVSRPGDLISQRAEELAAAWME